MIAQRKDGCHMRRGKASVVVRIGIVADEVLDDGGARKVDTDKVRPIPRSTGVGACQLTEAVS